MGKKIAIVGSGVAGSSVALYLGQLGLDVTVFEKESSFVSGPPFCHLHAGGNLYREIDDNQCISLLKQSIDFLRFYPYVIDYRPTVIAIPQVDSGNVKDLLPRLELLKNEYEKLIELDSKNRVLGDSCDYYKLYDKEDMENLKAKDIVEKPQTLDEWMVPVAQNVDLEKIKFPLIIVQEYGLNLFRLSAGVTLALDKIKNIKLNMKTKVTNITKTKRWEVSYLKDGLESSEEFDYLINATGFRTGEIDDMVGVKTHRMVEFKSAYITKFKSYEKTLFPEIIFHGVRGTPQGMGQFTPYPNGYFQLHGMTKDITLFEDGLVYSDSDSSQPKLSKSFLKKIDDSWSADEVESRTNKAIKHIANFIPKFQQAKVGSKPLYGAQQIVGDDPELRVAEVSFCIDGYARCEIVKVSSVMDMIDEIVKQLIKLKFLDDGVYKSRDLSYLDSLNKKDIESMAKKIAKSRDYPESLACLNNGVL